MTREESDGNTTRVRIKICCREYPDRNLVDGEKTQGESDALKPDIIRHRPIRND